MVLTEEIILRVAQKHWPHITGFNVSGRHPTWHPLDGYFQIPYNSHWGFFVHPDSTNGSHGLRQGAGYYNNKYIKEFDAPSPMDAGCAIRINGTELTFNQA